MDDQLTSEHNPGESSPRNDFDFGKYRDICDAHTEGARRLGLLEQEAAERSLNDPRSITTEIDGMKFPVLVPVEFVEGVDAERTKKIVAANGGEPREAYYYVLPPGLADTDMAQQLAMQIKDQKLQDMFVYFDYDSKDPKAKAEFEALISQLGREVSSVPLNDPEVQEQNRQAYLGLYATSVHRTELSESTPKSGLSIYEEFKKSVENGEHETLPQNGTALLKSSDIDHELRDAMWDVYIDRFQNLGEYHPITMEDTREGFEDLVNSPDSTFSVSFKDGQPVCWMVFCTSVEECTWLDPKFFNDKNLQKSEIEKMLFFPEIVARADDVGGYSEPTLRLAAEMTTRSGVDYRVVFESTNRSVEYIPYLVKKYIDDTEELTAETADELDKTMYACYKIANVG